MLKLILHFLILQGFRKVDPDRWEFANEGFLRGQRHLLRTIQRRKPAPHNSTSAAQHNSTVQTVVGQPSTVVEVGKFGLEGELERLKRDKHLLMSELVRLRQQQQATDREMRMLAQRMAASEQRQQQMMQFLAKAMHNPSFLSQLMQQSENRRQSLMRKKRRLPKADGTPVPVAPEVVADSQIIKYSPLDGDPRRVYMPYGYGHGHSPNGLDRSADFFHELQNMALDPGMMSPSGAGRPSGVKLEEMHPCVSTSDSPPHVHEIVNPEMDLSQSMLVHGAKVSHLGITQPLDQNIAPDMIPEPLVEPSAEIDAGMQTAEIDPSLNPANDMFWQQFFNEQNVEDPGLPMDATLENDIDGFVGDSWWAGNGNLQNSPPKPEAANGNSDLQVDKLAEQMGQHKLNVPS